MEKLHARVEMHILFLYLKKTLVDIEFHHSNQGLLNLKSQLETKLLHLLHKRLNNNIYHYHLVLRHMSDLYHIQTCC